MRADAPRIINQADGFADLGLALEAWELLETLPSADRMQPAVFPVHLKVCTALEKWQMGLELVRLIGPDNELHHREVAGRFHFARACALCGAGDVAGARATVSALSTVWPVGRLLVLTEIRLAELW